MMAAPSRSWSRCLGRHSGPGRSTPFHNARGLFCEGFDELSAVGSRVTHLDDGVIVPPFGVIEMQPAGIFWMRTGGNSHLVTVQDVPWPRLELLREPPQ